MRTIRTLGAMLLVGSTVGLAYGCSAAGNPAGVGDGDENLTPDASQAPNGYGTGDNAPPSDASAPVDSGKKSDAGKTDAGKATGPAKPAEGSPCDPAATGGADTQACGLCGTQTRACLGATDGGTGNAWGGWGYCSSEVTAADKCDPSIAYPSGACGNCGTIPQVCGSDCHFEKGFSCAEPTNSCSPGDTKFVLGASCTTSGQGRVYTCSPTCAFENPSSCQAPPPNPNAITIAPTAGDQVSKIFTLSATDKIGKISGSSCPASQSTSIMVSYNWISVINPTTRDVMVSLWDGPSTSTGSNYDTMMAWYATPATPTDAKACTSISDDCTGTTECSNDTYSRWSGLSGTKGASIPAGGSVTLYLGMYGAGTSGDIKVYAKTEN